MSTEPGKPEETDSVVDYVRRGDRTALETLFASHREYLRRVIEIRFSGKLHRRIDPSDIVQEAMMEALRRVPEYIRDPRLPVRLWMRQITIDRLRMSYRRHVSADKRAIDRELRLPDHSALTLAQQLIAGAGSPSMEIVRDELVQKIRQVIDGLEETDREIIVMQALEGLTSTESAQILGIEPATARKRYGRALLHMRRRLLESGLGGSRL